MIINAALCNQVFDEAVRQYRGNTSESEIPTYVDNIKQILYRKNWIDNTQWDAEDLIRDPKAPIQDIVKLKRQIDGLNQDRTDLIEKLDDIIFNHMIDVKIDSSARINTETPAWAIDRLSILHIKIFQMHKETIRADAADSHKESCTKKLNILQIQKDDLSMAIDQLLNEMESGRCHAKTYKQMKMYNDPELNPVLRVIK